MATNAVGLLDPLDSTASKYLFILPSCGDLLTVDSKVRGECFTRYFCYTLYSETNPIVQYQ